MSDALPDFAAGPKNGGMQVHVPPRYLKPPLMYPSHLMEFLALSEYPTDVRESFEELPHEVIGPGSNAVYMVEQMRPRGTWRLVKTVDGLKRQFMPSLQAMFRDTLRKQLPDTRHA